MTVDLVPRKYGVVLWFVGQDGCWTVAEAKDLTDLFVKIDKVIEAMIASLSRTPEPQPDISMTFLNLAASHADNARREVERIYHFKLQSEARLNFIK